MRGWDHRYHPTSSEIIGHHSTSLAVQMFHWGEATSELLCAEMYRQVTVPDVCSPLERLAYIQD